MKIFVRVCLLFSLLAAINPMGWNASAQARGWSDPNLSLPYPGDSPKPDDPPRCGPPCAGPPPFDNDSNTGGSGGGGGESGSLRESPTGFSNFGMNPALDNHSSDIEDSIIQKTTPNSVKPIPFPRVRPRRD